MMQSRTFHVAAVTLTALLVAGCPPEDDDSPDVGNGTTDAGTMEDGTSGEDADMTGEDDGMSDEDGGMTEDDGGTTEDDGGSAPRFEVIDCTEPDNSGKVVTVGPGKVYEPSDVTISSGQTVRWEWASDVSLPHDVVADEDSDCATANPDWFASEQSAEAGKTFCVRFNETGTWNYQCTVGNHCGAGMKGTVTVE